MRVRKKYVAGCCRLLTEEERAGTWRTADCHSSLEASSRWEARRWMRDKIKWADKHGFEIELTYYETESTRYEVEINENGKILIK